MISNSNLYYGPQQRPRSYSDITEVDPMKTPYTKTEFYLVNQRGFREQAWLPPPTSILEPELDWWVENEAETKCNRVGHH